MTEAELQRIERVVNGAPTTTLVTEIYAQAERVAGRDRRIAELIAERDALAKVISDPSIYSRMDKLQTENAALRKALEDAQENTAVAIAEYEALISHDSACASREIGVDHLGRLRSSQGKCNCRKSRIPEAR